MQRLCKKAPLSDILSYFPNTLPESVLTVWPKNDDESGSSFIDGLIVDVHRLSKASTSVNRGLKELKTLFKDDPAKPKDKELDRRIEENLSSLVQMKDLLLSLEPRKKRLWNNMLGGMVNDLSKRRRGCVVAQEAGRHDTEVVTQGVVNPDQEVTSQETASVNQAMSSQDTENDD